VRGEIGLCFEVFDEIKVSYSQKGAATEKLLPINGCKKGPQGSYMDCIEEWTWPAEP
jgi:hypothetical protein